MKDGIYMYNVFRSKFPCQTAEWDMQVHTPRVYAVTQQHSAYDQIYRLNLSKYKSTDGLWLFRTRLGFFLLEGFFHYTPHDFWTSIINPITNTPKYLYIPDDNLSILHSDINYQLLTSKLNNLYGENNCVLTTDHWNTVFILRHS